MNGTYRHVRMFVAVDWLHLCIASCMLNVNSIRKPLLPVSFICMCNTSPFEKFTTPRSISQQKIKDVELLKKVIELWGEFTTQVKQVCNLFMFLDRVYVLSRSELSSIWDFCMILFRSNALADPIIESAVVNALLCAIQEDRGSEMSEIAELVAQVVDMLTELKITDSWVKEKVLCASSAFFSSESDAKLRELKVPDYLQYACRRINDEQLRLENYHFDTIFRTSLLAQVRKAIVSSHFNTIIYTGILALCIVLYHV